jgi:hypothetical protein
MTDQTLQAGTAKVDITPPLTIPYLGYEPRHALFQAVHDPLYGRAVALDDGATQVMVIAADAIGFSNAILGPGRSFTAEVRQRVQQQTGVPAAHVLLASSHAHSTPETIDLRRLLDTPAAAAWLEVLIDQLASAAAMAFRQRRPCTLKAGKGQVQGLSHNRRILGPDGKVMQRSLQTPALVRENLGLIDPETGVLLLVDADSRSCTVLANFACHPVTVQVQPQVSADYPGVAMALVEQCVPNCLNSLFLQGACGNINPVRNTTGFDDVQRYGLMLGGEVVKLAAQCSAPEYPASPTRLAVAAETCYLPVRALPPRGPAQQAYDEAAAQLAAAQDEPAQAEWRRKQRVAEEALILIDRGTAPIPAEVQVVRIGDMALVALPGEPFVELGLEIKRRAVAPHTLVVGYANDWIGYLTTPQAWDEGGYEVSAGPWTRAAPEGSAQLVETALRLVETLFAPNG